jgi:diguanylate cyclase (GGDEF)-like protein
MDLAARYGGEEFACILPETDLNGAIAIAENIRQSIQALAIPHKGSKVAEVVTASLGVTTVRFLAHQSVDDILSQVDTLLYQAKSSGRNRVAFDREPATL